MYFRCVNHFEKLCNVYMLNLVGNVSIDLILKSYALSLLWFNSDDIPGDELFSL